MSKIEEYISSKGWAFNIATVNFPSTSVLCVMRVRVIST